MAHLLLPRRRDLTARAFEIEEQVRRGLIPARDQPFSTSRVGIPSSAGSSKPEHLGVGREP
jgi:hypothetical protein